jgi:hypothetical protein
MKARDGYQGLKMIMAIVAQGLKGYEVIIILIAVSLPKPF